jgi:hypothetical protein
LIKIKQCLGNVGNLWACRRIGCQRGDQSQPLGYEPEPRRIEGDGWPGVVKTVNRLPDPATDRELTAIRDDALTQAAGRVRYVRQARMVFSMTGGQPPLSGPVAMLVDIRSLL